MKAKTNGNGLAATDSGPKPGDFPLGSMESRAAARAVIAGTSRVDPYDRDCMLIYAFGSVLPYSTMYSDRLPGTDLYKRGRELSEAQHPTIPAHLDQHLQRCTTASLTFERVHRYDHHGYGGPRLREPRPGDTLTYAEVAASKGPDEILTEKAREAWERHFPAWPFPVRIENGRRLERLARPAPGQPEWEENDIFGLDRTWASIEQEALGLRDNPRPIYRNGMPYYPPDHNDPLIISAVVFVQPRNGKHCAEPLTWTDEATWPAEVAQIVGEWKRKLDNPSEQRPVEMRI
jgi:hypothetical protein